jgi:formylglycine-generating enzyme required for sulfatase activity/tRNA A-37 threonylcarbamoyl transferase component Bud32
MTLATVAGFVDALCSLPLLTAAQQAQLAVLQQQFSEAKALAQELIRRGWLTVYQANQLARGKGHELVLDRYVLLDLLGQGGMGAVYRARQTRMDRVVALKVIRPETLKAPTAVERFQREARLAAKLAHPNVVTVFDSGAAGDTHFLVMEYIEGIDLARLLKERGSLPVAEACVYVRQAALGLQHAFEQGLVHRDIKPANLMRTKQGVIKVMDLGLARAVSTADATATTGLTGTGVVMGTADYLAPEQARNATQVDIRADIYSLGCALYQLLAGRVPFPGETFTEKLIAHQMQEPEPVEKARAGLPRGLAQVVRTMMAKKPERRYQTPAEVARDLEPFAGGAGPGAGCRPVPAAAEMATAEPIRTPRGAAAPGVDRGSGSALRQRAGTFARLPGGLVGVVGCLGLLLVLGAVLGVVFSTALPDRGDSRPTSIRQPQAAAATFPEAAEARPPLLDCTGPDGTSIAAVKGAQGAWARYLGRQVNEEDEIAPGVKMTFVLVPPGKFHMGSPPGEPDRNPFRPEDDVEAQHEVTLTAPFYLGKYEVTQAQYEAVLGPDENPSTSKGPDLPVEKVTWPEARAYADRLTKQRADALVYRLPTEAEWEYACRGGRPGSLPFGVGDGTSLSSHQANFAGDFPYGNGAKGEYLGQARRVGWYPANALGLADMHGNVWEWCADWFAPYPVGKATNPTGPAEGERRIFRGGGWKASGQYCRAAVRFRVLPESRIVDLGFRLARVPPGAGE